MSNDVLNMAELQTLMAEGLKSSAQGLAEDQRKKLLQYIKLLDKWNKTFNLTAVRTPEKMLGLHILDSLSVLPFINGASVLDVGTGAGLPGIPLAIALPAANITMLDSLQKKVTFVRQAISELALENAQIVCNRVEQFQAPRQFEIVISRAFAELGDFVKAAAHLVAAQGRMLAMKGVYPHDEIARLPDTLKLEKVIELTVPQVVGKRHLVILKKA